MIPRAVPTEADRLKELERSHALLRATLESTADGILVLDEKENITGYNKVFLKLWTIPEQAIENKGYRWAMQYVLDQLVEPDHCVQRIDHLKDHPELESFDVLDFKDGRKFERYTRPQWLNGKVIGRVFSYRDVTMREESQRRLTLLADFSSRLATGRLDLQKILEITTQGAATHFQDGCMIRLFNETRTELETAAIWHPDRALCELMRKIIPDMRDIIDPEGMREVLTTGKGVIVALPPDQLGSRVKPELRRYLEKVRVQSWITVPLRSAGCITGAMTLFRRQGRPPYTSPDREFLQEMADRAAISIDNAKLFEKTQQALELREEFIMIASHELRTPLTPLKLQNQLLEMMLESGDVQVTSDAGRKLKAIIEDSDKHIERLLRLTNDMLDLARIKTGQLSLNKEKAELAAIVQEVVARTEHEQALPPGTISFRVSGESSGSWDRLRVEQVVDNLLTNAIKFGSGKPVNVSVGNVNGVVKVMVQDSGIGVAREDQERIFGRFERAAPAKAFSGFGMGLYLSRQLVEAMGGTITLESKPGEGAKFTVSLPVS